MMMLPDTLTQRLERHPHQLNIDLTSLPWETANIPYRDSQQINQKAEINFSVAGQDFTLIATRESDQDNTVPELIRIYIDWNHQLAYKGYVHITAQNDRYRAETGVGKMLRDEPALKGLAIGRKLAVAIHQYLQTAADRAHVSITDVAERSEDYPTANSGLAPEEWDAFFIPQLIQAGYTNTAPGKWQKTYQPALG